MCFTIFREEWPECIAKPPGQRTLSKKKMFCFKKTLLFYRMFDVIDVLLQCGRKTPCMRAIHLRVMKLERYVQRCS